MAATSPIDRTELERQQQKHPPSTASTAALSNPLILSITFEWLDRSLRGDLEEWEIERIYLKCARVNHLWHAEMLPYLWRHAEDFEGHNDLPHRLERINPARRQLHANLVERAFIRHFGFKGNNSWDRERASNRHHTLQGLTFPRLRRICYDFDEGDPVMPRIDAPQVEYVEVYSGMRNLDEPTHIDYDDMELVLDRIVELFPKAKTVDLRTQGYVYPGALERFIKRMPCLKELWDNCPEED